MRTMTIMTPPDVYAPLSPHGVSDDALRLQSGWEDLLRILLGSCTLGSPHVRVHNALATLAQETAAAGWDGYGAEPVSRDALAFARRLAQMLPFGLPAPDVSVDPDGEISFDWDGGAGRHLSCSVGPTGIMRYAGIVGESEAYGTEPWRDGIPDAILRLLQKVAPTDRRA